MNEPNLENKVEYPELNLPQHSTGDQIYGMFQTVTAVPTKEPLNWFNQIVYYKNGATLRIYIYDGTNHVWSYATLT